MAMFYRIHPESVSRLNKCASPAQLRRQHFNVTTPWRAHAVKNTWLKSRSRSGTTGTIKGTRSETQRAVLPTSSRPDLTQQCSSRTIFQPVTAYADGYVQTNTHSTTTVVRRSLKRPFTTRKSGNDVLTTGLHRTPLRRNQRAPELRRPRDRCPSAVDYSMLPGSVPHRRNGR